MQNFQDKMTNTERWITQRGELKTNHTSKIEFLLPKLYATKSVMYNFHVGDVQVKHGYNMILL